MPITSTTLFLHDHIVEVDIGIHDFEKAQPQRILISAEIDVEAGCGTQDDIATVLDYDFLRREIAALVDGRHFNLQETLCRSVITIIGRQPGVQAAVVSVRKPDVYPDCAAVGVRMRYRRSERSAGSTG